MNGEYVVALGPESSAKPGADVHLPTLSASVGAFIRVWMGVRPASGLAVTDLLVGSPDLLAALDQTLRLPGSIGISERNDTSLDLLTETHPEACDCTCSVVVDKENEINYD